MDFRAPSTMETHPQPTTVFRPVIQLSGHTVQTYYNQLYDRGRGRFGIRGHKIHNIRGRQCALYRYTCMHVRGRSRAGIICIIGCKRTKTCTIIRGRRNRINIHFASCSDVYRIYPHE